MVREPGRQDGSGLTVPSRKDGLVKVIARFDCQKAFQRMQTTRPEVLAAQRAGLTMSSQMLKLAGQVLR